MMRQRAFTLLEVMLASSIASVIMLTSFGLMQYVSRMDGKLATRFEDVAELGRAREAIRTAMTSLVGVVDPPDDPAANRTQTSIERFGEESLADRLFEDEEAPPPLFELGYTIPNRKGEMDPRKLVMRLRRSPIATEVTTQAVITGAFELVTYPLEPYFTQEGQESWALLWTPLDPPGEPVVLAEALKFAAWEALRDPQPPRNEMEYVDEHEARYIDDFPRVIHVELETWGGALADWLFEPVVEAREGE
jgi:prepilin-type N-terminal cleavage/methylation domain-containing protein